MDHRRPWRANPWTWRAAGVLAAGVILWVLAAPACIRRDISLRIDEFPGNRRCALEWRSDDGAPYNGVWLEGVSHLDTSATFSLRVPPQTQASGEPVEIWLLAMHVPNSSAPPVPLPRADQAIASDNARWLDAADGPGLIYLGASGGSVLTHVPAGGLEVHLLASAKGGRVEIEYEGARQTVDLRSSSTQRRVVTVASPDASSGTVDVRQRLPAYTIESIRVRGPSPLSHQSIRDVRLTVRLFGAVVTSRGGSASPPDAPDAEAAPMDPGPGVVAQIGVSTEIPWWAHAVGALAACAAAAGAAGAFAVGSCVVSWLAPRPWKWHALVACLVLGVHLWAALSTRFILTGDAVDYLVGAARFARDGSFSGLSPFKAPLFSIVLAAPVAIGADPITWARVMLVLAGGLLCPALVYATLRRLTAQTPALLGALACGLNPILITLETYLLRETFGACVVAALAYLLSRSTTRPMLAALALGALAGLGALLRENFQTLLAIVPLAILLLPGWPGRPSRRILPALAALLVALACVGHWYVIHADRFDRPGMTLPKVNLNKALNAWSNGTLDLNQTRAVSPSTYDVLSSRRAAHLLSDYGAVYGVLDATEPDIPPLIRERPEPADPASLTDRELRERSAWAERTTALMVEESAARAPEAVWRARAVAMLSLTGTWIYPEHPSAPSIEWMSRPLRRLSQGHPTTVQVGTLVDHVYEQEWAALEPLVRRHEAPLPESTSPTFAPWFERLFRGNQLLRPVLALLCVAAAVGAWRRRAWPVLALASIIAINLAGAALVVVTPVDRVAAPFIPGMIVLAAWILWVWVARPGNLPGSEYPSPQGPVAQR
ncbi:MAG: glycosyltransferase family 39 protein [Planctomycetota bacterium]|nr:glycosyltransferase family 39 protein [Planctomycetota bacterium]